MWSLLKWLAMRLAIVRWIVKILGLAAFLPIALLLKAVGQAVMVPDVEPSLVREFLARKLARAS